MSFIEPKENELYKDYINRILNSRPNTKLDDVYQERHHITPKCLGGSNDKDNLIYLYAQEHYYAHKLLALENPNENGLTASWWKMCHPVESNQIRNYEISADDYSKAKELHSLTHSKRMTGEGNPNYGKHFSEEHKQKIKEHANWKVRCRKIRCKETGEEFDSSQDAANWCGLKSNSTIIKNCKNKRNSAGKHPITKEKLHWEYVN